MRPTSNVTERRSLGHDPERSKALSKAAHDEYEKLYGRKRVHVHVVTRNGLKRAYDRFLITNDLWRYVDRYKKDNVVVFATVFLEPTEVIFNNWATCWDIFHSGVMQQWEGGYDFDLADNVDILHSMETFQPCIATPMS